MENDKVTSAKNAVGNMLIYYHQALVDTGCGDPKQVIATNLAQLIKLSDGQKEYIIDNSKTLSPKKILDDITILLTKMEQDNKLDKSYTMAIKKSIEILVKMIKKEE